MQDPYGALIALVLFDKKIHSREQEIVSLKKNLEQLTVSHQLALAAFNALQQSQMALVKKQDALDLELKSSMQEYARLNRILGQAVSAKEITALTNEKACVAAHSEELEGAIEKI